MNVRIVRELDLASRGESAWPLLLGADMRANLRVAIAVLGVAVGVMLVAPLAKPLLVLFGGLLFALVLRSASTTLSRVSRLPYRVCLGIVVATMVALMALGAVTAGPSLRDQLSDLAVRLPEAA